MEAEFSFFFLRVMYVEEEAVYVLTKRMFTWLGKPEKWINGLGNR